MVLRYDVRVEIVKRIFNTDEWKLGILPFSLLVESMLDRPCY